MAIVKLDTGYRPRELQQEIHQNLKRWSVLVCHRRFGKTVLCINLLVDAALNCNLERPRYAYFAPLYRQAKQAAWDYLVEYTRAIPGVETYVSELRVDLPNGARIQLFGSDNPDAVRGIYLDGCVLDEYAQMPARMFAEVLRPALSDRKGWTVFIGTPAGKNAFHDLYQQAIADDDWFATIYKASDTGVVDADELAMAKRHMSTDQYNQEFECSFESAIPGAYYGVLMREALDAGRITSVPHDPAMGVETFWDLGIGDATAIWFLQRIGANEMHAIDYYENSGEGIAHYVNVLQSKREEHRYNYKTHVLPHDAMARSLQTGTTLSATLQDLTGMEPVIIEQASVAHGIEAARNLIPRTWFDVEKCERGLECLRQYKQHWDDKRQSYTNKPYHDWTSHGADAFRMAAMYKPQDSWTGWDRQVVWPDVGAY